MIKEPLDGIFTSWDEVVPDMCSQLIAHMVLQVMWLLTNTKLAINNLRKKIISSMDEFFNNST